jgi:hypothetical protein
MSDTTNRDGTAQLLKTTREVRFASIFKRTHQRPMKLRLTQDFKLVSCQGLHTGKNTSIAICSPEGYTTQDKPATEFPSAGFCEGKNVRVYSDGWEITEYLNGKNEESSRFGHLHQRI